MRISAYSIFSLILTVIVLVMIMLSFNLNEKARFFPLLFGSITFGLLLFQVLSDCFIGIEKKLTFVSQGSAFTKLFETGETEQKSALKDKTKSLPLINVIRLFLWLTGLTLAMRFLNYTAVVTVFIFLMIAVEAKAGWFRALVIALCAGLFIFLLFAVILQVNFQA